MKLAASTTASDSFPSAGASEELPSVPKKLYYRGFGRSFGSRKTLGIIHIAEAYARFYHFRDFNGPQTSLRTGGGKSGLGESDQSLTNVQCLPGAMLKQRHTHECKPGYSCGRALLDDTAGRTQSHTLFNQGPPEAGLKAGRG